MLETDVYIGLIFACSKGIEEQDCPLKNIRKLEIDERFKIWNNFSKEEKQKIINHHINCVDNEWRNFRKD